MVNTMKCDLSGLGNLGNTRSKCGDGRRGNAHYMNANNDKQNGS